MEKEKKFEEIYNRYKRDVLNYLYYLTGSKELAEDLFQETFLKFWKAFKKIEDFSNIKSYLLKIAKNLFIDLKRKEKKFRTVSFEEEIFLVESEDYYEKAKKKEKIKKILEFLSDEEREIIILRFYENLKFKEISEILGINESTCRVKFMRILEKLRKKYEKEFFEMA